MPVKLDPPLFASMVREKAKWLEKQAAIARGGYGRGPAQYLAEANARAYEDAAGVLREHAKRIEAMPIPGVE